MKSVFISSTFKDMQSERDWLHEIVFPKLRKIMQEYGEDIQELDLRWGVDTSDMSEEESGHQVLKVCIDAIDRCHPYIIVLLGERYGWIPDFNIVQSLQDTRMDNLYEEEMRFAQKRMPLSWNIPPTGIRKNKRSAVWMPLPSSLRIK